MAKKIDEAAVWQRVSAASRSAGPEAPVPKPLAPELLEALWEAQRRANAYGRLYRQTGKAAFSQLLRQERQSAAKLSGLYYLMKETAPPRGSLPAFSASGKKLLRRLLNGEEQAAGRLEALSEKAGGEMKETLRALGAQARSHWGRLLELLGQEM